MTKRMKSVMWARKFVHEKNEIHFINFFIDYINSYFAKKFDDELYIGLITNYNTDLWHVEYEDRDEEVFDAIEVQRGIQSHNSLK